MFYPWSQAGLVCINEKHAQAGKHPLETWAHFNMQLINWFKPKLHGMKKSITIFSGFLTVDHFHKTLLPIMLITFRGFWRRRKKQLPPVILCVWSKSIYCKNRIAWAGAYHNSTFTLRGSPDAQGFHYNSTPGITNTTYQLHVAESCTDNRTDNIGM